MCMWEVTEKELGPREHYIAMHERGPRECVNHLLIWQLMQARPSLDYAACDQSVGTKEKPWVPLIQDTLLLLVNIIPYMRTMVLYRCEWDSGWRKLPVIFHLPISHWQLHMHHVHDLSQKKMPSEGWQLARLSCGRCWGETMKVINSRDFPVKSASNFQAAWT